MSTVNRIDSILSSSHIGDNVELQGWVRTKRIGKSVAFLTINDGSTFKNIQVVIDLDTVNVGVLDNVNTGTSVFISGSVVKSVGCEQDIEIKLTYLSVLGYANGFPIQPKKHSMEFLRDIAHLRFRTNTFSAIFRIRNRICFAIHKFFQERGFVYVNTPLITSSDAEGAGEMFTVTSLDLREIRHDIDFNNDFFGEHVNLTVSGQLEAEAAIFGLGAVYTFGPTFRAENSNTTRHLAEFWMVEPEMAFYDLKGDMQLVEDFFKYVISDVLDKCHDELVFLNEKLKKENGTSLIDKLENTISASFNVITYSDALDILKRDDAKFTYTVDTWGCDLQSEHEKYIVDKVFNSKPVIVIDYPKSLKAFYMRLNDDNRTVAAMDVLFSGIGEIVGGSQREERLDYLNQAIEQRGIKTDAVKWYLDTRRFGSVVHAGFGLGLERLVQYVTGIDNIRDVIPFPRYPGHAKY